MGCVSTFQSVWIPVRCVELLVLLLYFLITACWGFGVNVPTTWLAGTVAGYWTRPSQASQRIKDLDLLDCS